ncbi:hypothetical protein PENSPDRAFT_694078 [Peniophora sp. CONT]|nr:hypothetical protein PENSPDRAFT_694078 [Peniophora sp. CONT]
MAPQKSKSASSAERVPSTSPYVSSNIFRDASVTALADNLRAKRPALRVQSSLLKKLPFLYSAIFKEQSLNEWLQRELSCPAEDDDFLFEYAKYLDWWERSGVYQDVSDGKDRRKLKELRLTIRRYGLEKEEISPSPDQFISIQNRGALTWTDTHQWLILLRFFDVLADLRGLPTSSTDHVPPSPSILLALTDSVSSPWLGMRVDWQASVNAAIAVVKAAKSVHPRDNAGPSGAPLQIQGDVTSTSGDGSLAPIDQSSVSQETPASTFAHPLSPVSEEPPASTSAQPSSSAAVVSRAIPDMDLLFSKFDKMALTAAFESIVPSVKKADQTSQYLAMRVNIQLAALVVNYIQTNVHETEHFFLGELSAKLPGEKADWMSTRYIYQSFMVMITYSPLFLLSRTRLYSSPLPNLAVAFEIFKAMGNVGKPEPLKLLERSIWGMVLQVAQGADVEEILPVYMSAWVTDLDGPAVTECKSWLDDFGLNAAAQTQGPIQDWDDVDLLQVGKDYIAQRDENRVWKLEINEHGKRSRSPTLNRDAVDKRPPRKKPTRPVSDAKVKRSSTSARGTEDRRSTRKAPPAGSSSRSRTQPPSRARADSRGDRASGDEDAEDSDDPINGSRLTPASDDGLVEALAGQSHLVDSEGLDKGSRGHSPMDVDGDANGPRVELPDDDVSPLQVGPSFSRAKAGGKALRASSRDESELVQASIPRARAMSQPVSRPVFVGSPVEVPAWSAQGMEKLKWTPSRQNTNNLFELLSQRAVTDYAPGTENSAISVFSATEFSALSSSEVAEIFSKRSIVIRGGEVDPFWSWGFAAFSAIRPITGTINVQDAVESFTSEGFLSTFPISVSEFVKAGMPDGGRRMNCLDLPVGERRLRNIPHIAGHGTFNVLPYLFNVAAQDNMLNVSEAVKKLHWALAGVAGAETTQHIDSGGYSTVVEVLSGRKLWAVGVREDGVAFSNDSHCFALATEEGDWQSIDCKGMRWESLMLHAGDAFIMRPGPHMVYTPESSLCYGEYVITPTTMVEQATSFAMTLIGDNIVTNDRIPEALPLHLAFSSWWWHGDLECEGEVFDPSARACRPDLQLHPEIYVALFSMNVFQTTLAATTYDEEELKSLGVTLEYVGERIYRNECERIYEWVLRQGIIARQGVTVDRDASDDDRVALLREIVLDYGRGIFKMSVEHARTNSNFASASLRKRLLLDARSAYKVTKDFIDRIAFNAMPLIPAVVFVPSPRPDLTFAFGR